MPFGQKPVGQIPLKKSIKKSCGTNCFWTNACWLNAHWTNACRTIAYWQNACWFVCQFCCKIKVRQATVFRPKGVEPCRTKSKIVRINCSEDIFQKKNISNKHC